MLYALDWCVVCTGLVCCMHWTGVLYVLDWCVVCTGLMCCMYWTGVLYVLDWYIVCTGLVCCMLDWCVLCIRLICTGLVCTGMLEWSVAKGHQNISGGYEGGSCSGGCGNIPWPTTYSCPIFLYMLKCRHSTHIP